MAATNVDATSREPLPVNAPVPRQPTNDWQHAVVGLGALGGGFLMLYGNAQNSTRGIGPATSILGAVIVTTLACAIVVTSLIHSTFHKRQTQDPYESPHDRKGKST